MTKHLKESDLQDIFQSLHDAGMNLFLGAGASIGAIGGDGNELQGAEQLSAELCRHFSTEHDKHEAKDLALVYGDIFSDQQKRPLLLDFFKRRFSNCNPSWQCILLKFKWKRIWTLNIDDIIDSCAKKVPIKIRTFSWNSPLEIRSLVNNEFLQVVHLHGRASHIGSNDNELIFSISDYASKPEITPGWHSELRSELARKPFIICGASLDKEYDLATILNYGNHSRERGGCPSVVVLKDITASQRTRLERYGFIVIQATGEDFFAYLSEQYEHWKKTHIDEGESQAARIEVAQKFKTLNLQSLRRKVIDFYSSTETQWEHIISDLDAHLDIVQKTINLFAKEAKNKPQNIIIYGDNVSGKTASAYRVCNEMLQNGYNVQQFRAEARFDEDAIIHYLKIHPKSLLFFDDCAEHSSSIASLSKKCHENNMAAKILLTCHKKNLRAVQIDFCDSEMVVSLSTEPLVRKDFLKIVAKRRDKGRLGRNSNDGDQDIWKEFQRKYNFHFLEWLESLENARSFQDIIAEITSSKIGGKDYIKHLVSYTAATHRFGLSLPFFIINELQYPIKDTELSPEALTSDNGILKDFSFLDDKGMRLRSAALSTNIWNKLITRDERFNILYSMASMLSPLVVKQSIKARTLPYIILRQIMDNESIHRDLGSRAEEWFEKTEILFGWNARYWEQRALLNLKKPDEYTAYSFAKKAISVHNKDAFPYTTLGKVCLTIACERKDQTAVDRYWEGVESLDISRRMALRNGYEWEHPYITFFTYSLKAAQRNIFRDELSNINIAWKRWMGDAQSSRKLTFDESGRSKLDSYQSEWLRLFTKEMIGNLKAND